VALDEAAQRRRPVGEGEGAVEEAMGGDAYDGDAGEEGGVALDNGVEEMGGSDGEGGYGRWVECGLTRRGGGGEGLGEQGFEAGLDAVGDFWGGGFFVMGEDS
jgi:hypothetical protein